MTTIRAGRSMRIFRYTRTPIAALIVLTLLAQSVLAGPASCRCNASNSEVEAKACCHTEAESPPCCAKRSSCCDPSGKCGQTRLCKCGCDQHRSDPPVAPLSPSENTDVKQKLAANAALKLVDVAVLSHGDRPATIGVSAHDRASPSVQVILCIWQT